MKKIALTGLSIAHSKNPRLFAAAYHGRPGYSYELMPAASAEEAVRLFRANGLCGMNVTMPFKNDILNYVDEQSPEAQAVGAANTVVLRDGKLVAYNTDIVGVSESLTQHGGALKGQPALVLGAGGAGRAAVYALLQAGANVWWTNRTEHKTTEPVAPPVARAKRARATPLSALPALINEIRIIVNTLPLAAAELLQALHLQKHHIVLDADYTGRPLYEAAALAAATYISGLSWLLYQAVPAYRLFTGEAPDAEAMKFYLNSSS